jgi:hypothetical protein
MNDESLRLYQKLYMREWRKLNPEKIREQSRIRRERFRERVNEYMKHYMRKRRALK